jgi:hypothetical protein
MGSGPDGASVVVGVFIGAILLAALFDGCGVDTSTPVERCTRYCGWSGYDGGKLATSQRGYACGCSDLQKVKAP